MGRKNKNDAPNPSSIANRDIIQRLNFLYQASAYLNGLGAAHAEVGPSKAALHSRKSKRTSPRQMKKEECTRSQAYNTTIATGDTQVRSGQRKATVHDLARSYVKSMKTIGQKTNVKMDPTIKRTLCKGCNMLLMPGVTADVRVKPLPSHGHAVSYACRNCSFSRRIPAPPTLEQAARPSSMQSDKETTLATVEMDIDPVDDLLDHVQEVTKTTRRGNPPPRRKKKVAKPRLPPFFERKAHILFVGNERVGQNAEIN